MTALLDMLQSQIGDGEIAQLTRSLGADEGQVRKAVAGALPLLVSGLARNAQEPQGAAALAGALERDHDGGILDQLGSFLGSAGSADGAGILGHVFGGRSEAAARGVGQLSGLDAGKAGQLLAMLAPIVLGALGRMKQERSMGPGDLGDLLGREHDNLRQRGGGTDLLSSLLDRDGDGSVMDDALEIGGGLLGSFLKGRR
jgi:hypothetical protein